LMNAWGNWNPAAGYFHHATRDLEYMPSDQQERVVRQKALTRRPPLPIKRLPGTETLRLPRFRASHPFSDVLLARRTWREFADGPVSREELGTLLDLTAGVQRWEKATDRRVALKTSPSGGATHPGELYVMALNVSDLARGLYHYRADTNALELVRQGARRTDVERYMPHQWWYRRAAVVVFFTAVFARSMWRYSYPRAYRALLIEAGHLCQTFCLTATWLGLAPFCVMALADSAIEKDLGLDGHTEAVLYAAGVGRRPPGIDWAPAPRDEAWPGGPPRSQVRSASHRRKRR
jgi:SagB-type dehydrogenase family enzyme